MSGYKNKDTDNKKVPGPGQYDADIYKAKRPASAKIGTSTRG